ncbi:type II toxin-antitoxin system prevent-host-death family antitoxin [soil metagenome]
MSVYTVHKAKTHFSKLVKEVENGGEVVISRGPVAVAKLVPLEPFVIRKFGVLKGKFAVPPSFFEPLPRAELDAWEE